MTVLTIIAILIAHTALFVKLCNEHSMRVYEYEIFNATNFTLSIAIYFGHGWYIEALQKDGDVLNGELVMGIGALLLLIAVYMNIKNTSLKYGISMSIITEVLYAVATPVVFFILLIAFAFFAQTKPVYNIND